MLTCAGSKTGVLTAAALSILAIGCRKEDAGLADQSQIGSSIGEVMASADESANGGSSTAMHVVPILHAPDQLKPPLWQRAMDALIPSAYAASCLPVTFSACASGVRSATFTNCDVGKVTVNGSIDLTFSDAAACNIATVGDSVNRTGSLTLSALGGSLAVTSPGGGQTLTRTSGGFTFAVPGMERVLTLPSGKELFDITTMTISPLTITGSSRSDMVITGGTLAVNHNLGFYSVSLTPDNLTWTPACNCASSGSLTGTVTSSDAADLSKSVTVTITGCGTADVTVDGNDTQSVTMDRCGAV